MAKVDITLPKSYLMRISKLGDKTDEVCEKMLETGAEVVEAKVRSNLQSAIGSNIKISPSRSTGELLDSLGTSPAQVDKDGIINVHIGFNEPRRKQYAARGKRSYNEITNAMIANVIEYGKSGQPPKPFLKTAVSAAKKESKAAMKKKFDEEVGKI